MADKFAGGIIAGSTSLDIPVLLRVKSDGAELTGKVATAVVAYYWRQSAVSAIEITCATLGSLGAAYAAGGWYEVGSVMPGAYRLCVPNTALSTGADWVAFGVKDTAGSGFMFYEKYHLATGVYLADGAITSAKIGADAIGSDKIAAGALVYDDQIVTFKSELSGMVVTIPNGHITSAKIGADAFASDKFAAGCFVYGDQITAFDASIKSAASEAWNSAAATVRVYPADGALTAAVFGADCITSGKVAAGALTYDDQITTFKSEISGLYTRLTTLGVRDITQYASAQGGVPGSSPALIDAIYWMNANMAYMKIQTPTTYLVHNAAGTPLASAPISGTSTSVTVGIFTNV